MLVDKQVIMHICDKCDKISKMEMYLANGGVLMKPCLPHGWTEIRGKHYCEDHEVNVEITVTDKG